MGRLELLGYFREQSVSETVHRYGNLTRRRAVSKRTAREEEGVNPVFQVSWSSNEVMTLRVVRVFYRLFLPANLMQN